MQVADLCLLRAGFSPGQRTCIAFDYRDDRLQFPRTSNKPFASRHRRATWARVRITLKRLHELLARPMPGSPN